jgi:hypothetical protein
MPTLAIIGPYRFFFFSDEGIEPPHIHVRRDSAMAKFWLNPVVLAFNAGFTARELRQIGKLVIEHQLTWTEKWNEYFNQR